MRVLIVGAGGQLGSDLVRAFADLGPIGLDHKALDIEVPSSVSRTLARYRPTVVINTAAFHNVEVCETRPDRAFAVNALAADDLAAQCALAGAQLVHISTDYVFDGQSPVAYGEGSPTNPLSAYGTSKLAGELLIKRHLDDYFIIRTSGLYGIRGSSVKGYTFIERILTQASEGRPLDVVNDITFSPSYTRHVADAIRRIVERRVFGTYHVTNTGRSSCKRASPPSCARPLPSGFRRWRGDRNSRLCGTARWTPSGSQPCRHGAKAFVTIYVSAKLRLPG